MASSLESSIVRSLSRLVVESPDGAGGLWIQRECLIQWLSSMRLTKPERYIDTCFRDERVEVLRYSDASALCDVTVVPLLAEFCGLSSGWVHWGRVLPAVSANFNVLRHRAAAAGGVAVGADAAGSAPPEEGQSAIVAHQPPYPDVDAGVIAPRGSDISGDDAAAEILFTKDIVVA
eukprot:4301446-Pyramimonas_sp.AAC.1